VAEGAADPALGHTNGSGTAVVVALLSVDTEKNGERCERR
jgi:hypothetical protein